MRLNQINIAPAVGFILAMTLVFSCKEDASPEEEFLKKVSGTWTSSSTGVTVDGTAVNGAFAGFSLTIEGNGNFSTQNGNDPIWPASGKLQAVANSSAVGFEFTRSDGVQVLIDQFTDASLVLSFQYTDPNGRTASVSGIYVFDLIKN